MSSSVFNFILIELLRSLSVQHLRGRPGPRPRPYTFKYYNTTVAFYAPVSDLEQTTASLVLGSVAQDDVCSPPPTRRMQEKHYDYVERRRMVHHKQVLRSMWLSMCQRRQYGLRTKYSTLG